MAQRLALSRTVFSALSLAACALALFASPGAAATFNRNEAHIDWRTVETEHFRFHYAAKLEPVAGYIAGIAEGVAEEKLKRYHIRLPNKVEFLIREDIFSNGWANSLQNIMTVWVADWDFPIRSTHNWLKDVVTHEFAHLVSIQSGSKFASPIQGLVVGYQDYYNEPVQASAATIIPFTQQPNWFAEGVAQYESELSGYDAWDSHRDMLLRTAALQNKLLGYDRMGSFAGTSLEYELGPYTQGFAFVRWLAEKHGDAAVIKLWAENARLHRQTLSGSMERVLGKDGYGQWKDWKNAVTAQYADQVKALGPLRMGKKLTSEGFYNYYPRWDHKGENLFFISNRGRDDFKGALYLYKLGDSAKKEEERLKMIAPVRSPFDVAADDSTFLYHSAKNQDKDGMSKLDIYQRNLRRKGGFFEFGPDPTERRYTKDENAVQASYDREGKRIVFVRNRMTNFQLCVAPVPDAPKARGKGRADVDSEEVKVLFPPDSLLESRFGFNIYTPRFSPDGKAIVFSFYDGTSRNIGIINSDGTGFRRLLDRPYDERDPEWAPDGKSLFFSADSNAIYNIYRADVGRDSSGGFAAGAPLALTQVSGGAFSPTVDPSGKRLAYVNYDTTGFSLYLLTDLAPSGAPPTALRTLHPEDGAIEAIAFEGRSEAYVGIPNRFLVNPLLIGEEMSSRDRTARKGEAKWLAGFNGLLNDPVDRNEVSAALLLEVGNGLDYFGANDEILSPDKESQFYLGWMNRSTPVTLDLAFARGNLTSHDTVTVRDKLGEAPESRENTDYAITFRNVEAGLSYNLFDAGAVEDDYHTSFVRLAGGYAWNDFNFYTGSFPFAFEYYNNLYLSAMANFYGATYSDKELIAPQGLAAAVAYSYDKSGIVRRGSFWDVFEVSPEGAVFTKFRDYTLNNLDAGVTYGIGLPWSDNGSVVASGFVGSLLSWEVANPDSGADTLDTFFSKGLFLRGYPFLRDIENLAFQGENTLKVSADLNQPILPDIYKAYWVLFVEDLYLNLFWEAGRAWTGPLWETGIFDKEAWGSGADGWFQSAGWGLKLNARIYHNYPFLAYFEAATALSGVPDGKGNLESLETVKIPIGGRGTEINTYATRISFGVSFGFYNGLLGGSPAKAVRNPYRPESPLARR